MSAMSPTELETLTAQLLAAGRSERPSPERAAHGLDALIQGAVKSAGFEPPELAVPRPWLKRGVWLVGIAGLVAGLWYLNRPTVVEPISPAPLRDGLGAAEPPPPLPLAPVEPLPAEPPPAPEAASPPPPAGPPPSPPPPSKPRPTRAPAEEVDALARELALLDRARTQLGANPRDALATLGSYRQKFPQGSLRVEADVLRVETLLKLQRRAEAQSLAARLIGADREGLIRDRLERLLKEAP